MEFNQKSIRQGIYKHTLHLQSIRRPVIRQAHRTGTRDMKTMGSRQIKGESVPNYGDELNPPIEDTKLLS